MIGKKQACPSIYFRNEKEENLVRRELTVKALDERQR